MSGAAHRARTQRIARRDVRSSLRGAPRCGRSSGSADRDRTACETGARESSSGPAPSNRHHRRVSRSCPSRGWGLPRRRRCLPASRGRLVRRRRWLCRLVWLTTGERSRCVYAVPTVARVARCSRGARAPWVRDVHSLHRSSRADSSSLCERCFITRAALQSVACVLPRHSATAGARVPPREPGVDRAAAPSRASRARRACPRLNHELGRHVLSRMAHAL